MGNQPPQLLFLVQHPLFFLSFASLLFFFYFFFFIFHLSSLSRLFTSPSFPSFSFFLPSSLPLILPHSISNLFHPPKRTNAHTYIHPAHRYSKASFLLHLSNNKGLHSHSFLIQKVSNTSMSLLLRGNKKKHPYCGPTQPTRGIYTIPSHLRLFLFLPSTPFAHAAASSNLPFHTHTLSLSLFPLSLSLSSGNIITIASCIHSYPSLSIPPSPIIIPLPWSTVLPPLPSVTQYFNCSTLVPSVVINWKRCACYIVVVLLVKPFLTLVFVLSLLRSCPLLSSLRQQYQPPALALLSFSIQPSPLSLVHPLHTETTQAVHPFLSPYFPFYPISSHPLSSHS
ncbi:MAG: hypothetical protein JOS17DRAFT_393513 [Linnemannia elongata]|nr:MAG: hypothetical protein JOS17DRAFT_393513 [Linnemannia elongata]